MSVRVLNMSVQNAGFEFPTREGETARNCEYTYILFSVGFVKSSLRIKSEAVSRTKGSEERTDLIKVTLQSRVDKASVSRRFFCDCFRKMDTTIKT